MSKVAIIGLGYVGLPLWINFSKHVETIGFDVDEKKINTLNSSQSYIKHFGNAEIQKSIERGAEATTDFSRISEAKMIIICVPTPLTKNKDPDMKYVLSVLDLIKKYLKSGQILSLESTTYPGTTEELIKPIIESEGFKVGSDFHLIYSPERENPGGEISQENIPKVIGGVTKKCTDLGVSFYSKVFKEMVPVSSPKIAELVKLLENIHRAVNLGMINEFKMICDKMGIDTYEVVKAAASKPFGFVPYYPGPGWGGHCIPVDPFYFSWKAKEYGSTARFIELAGEMNELVIDWIKLKIQSLLNNQNKAVSNSKVLLLGLSYKENVDDARESPSLEIFDFLSKNGSEVEYSDPHFPDFPITRKFNYKQKSVNINKDSLSDYDLVVVLTKHNAFDYELILQHAKMILDTRGVFEVDNKNVFRG